MVGDKVGVMVMVLMVSVSVGLLLDSSVGGMVGVAVGAPLGSDEGGLLGAMVGSGVGANEVGEKEGLPVNIGGCANPSACSPFSTLAQKNWR